MTTTRHGPDAIAPGQLTRCGLSRDADLLYRAVASLGPRSAASLVHHLGLPPRRVANALGDLHAAGAVVAVADGRWQALSGAQVSAKLRRARRPAGPADDQSARQRFHVDRLIGDGAVALGHGVRQLRDRRATRERLAELVAVERYEHLAINTEQQVTAEVAQAAIPIHRTVLGRGIHARAISPPSVDEDTALGPMRELTQLRVQSRETCAVPLKVFIIDRRVALFPLVPHDHDRGFLEISQAPVVAALHAQFEQCWAEAVDSEEQAVPNMSLSPRERELVTLLAAGHTDATAARELHIGTRSVTKLLRGLMDRLEVQNRFQLGLALGALRAATPSPRPPNQHEESR